MLRLTLRNIARRKLRYALTTLAVVLGVAFLSTSFFLTDKIRDTFDELATDITGNLDLVVRTSIGEGERLNRPPFPKSSRRSWPRSRASAEVAPRDRHVERRPPSSPPTATRRPVQSPRGPLHSLA